MSFKEIMNRCAGFLGLFNDHGTLVNARFRDTPDTPTWRQRRTLSSGSGGLSDSFDDSSIAQKLGDRVSGYLVSIIIQVRIGWVIQLDGIVGL